MKKLFLMSLSIFYLGCNGQNNNNLNKNVGSNIKMGKTIEKLDLDYIKNHAQKISYRVQGAVSSEVLSDEKPNMIYYKLDEVKNGKKIYIEGDEENGFTSEIKYLNSDYLEYISYDGKGNLLTKIKQSVYGFLIEEQEYNERRKLIKSIDYDNEFKFKWEGVKEYLKTLNVKTDINSFNNHPYPNKDIPIPIIKREFIKDTNQTQQYPVGTKKIWCLENVEGIYDNKKGIYSIILDGDSGEVLIVKEFKGKKSGSEGFGTYADYELIYSKLANKKQSSTYKTYEGKDYTRSEWEEFEQKQFEDYARKHNISIAKNDKKDTNGFTSRFLLDD
ncbi:hypothetical protein [Apibacter sp. HY039]|uniref:hypothetical protein n=1 Tax=Apibacter sp. HY039 TaxID=2501476 RepID=UPI000FEB61AB|nr:hypothetical protein [Apibacter sp. HY039]